MSESHDGDPFSRSTLIANSPTQSTMLEPTCRLCPNASNLNMISCGVCSQKVHLKCIGLSLNPNKKWICRACSKQTSRPAASSTRTTNVEKCQDKTETRSCIENANETVKIRHSSTNHAPKSLHNTNQVETTRTVNDIVKQSTLSTTNGVDPKPPQTNDELVPKALDHTPGDNLTNERQRSKPGDNESKSECRRSNSGRNSSKHGSKAQRRDLKLAKHEEWAELQRTIFQEKWKILESLGSDSETTTTEVEEKRERVSDWVEQQNNTEVLHKSYGRLVDNIDPKLLPSTSKVSNLCGLAKIDVQRPTINNKRRDSETPWLLAQNQKQFMDSIIIPDRYKKRTDEAFNTSMRQMTLRQGSFDLPYFSGDPIEWPAFISAFIRSTKSYAISNEDNLIRLQKSLKGKALAAVRGKMILPNTVPHVLNTLRMLFGRPEVIVGKLVEQVRREPKVNTEKLDTLIEFAMSVQHLCATMEASGMLNHLNNPILLEELVDKLPGSLKLQWASFKMSIECVDLSTFNSWLTELADAASSVTSVKMSQFVDEKPSRRVDRRHGAILAAHTTGKAVATNNPTSCVVCDEAKHTPADCPKFQKLEVKERWNTIRTKRLCRKCLHTHHVSKCKSKKDCGVNGCVFKHHPLLHDNEIHNTEITRKPYPSPSSTFVGAHSSVKTIISRIVPVVLHGKRTSVRTYAFLDDGSHLTLIDEEIARNLELEGPAEDLCLQWTSNMTRIEKNSKKVSVSISGTDNSNKYKMDGVCTVKSLELPAQSIAFDISKFQHLKDLSFQRYANAKPRILIGLAHVGLTVTLELREGHWGEPVAARTRLGWTIYGSISDKAKGKTTTTNVHMFHKNLASSDEHMLEAVRDYFSLESFGIHCPTKMPESQDDIRAKKIMKDVTKFNGTRYETGLIWKYDNFQFPNSMPMALRRLESLERKMAKDTQMAKSLNEQIQNYVTSGYARRLSCSEAKATDGKTWYLPIFTVKNPNKPEKTRLVWDAAAQVGGVSLNTALLKGPDFLMALPDILLHFRENSVAVSGDIKEMFHQVKIRVPDQNSQRFLWRNGNSSRDPDIYVMAVMTFGACCSPSSAHYVKNQNALRFEAEQPMAVNEIIYHHYVDDWITSFPTEEEAIHTALQVKKIHASGGFQIRNWTSNSETVLKVLGERTEKTDGNLEVCEEVNARVLGMRWSASKDVFFFHLNLDRIGKDILMGQRIPTKREVLRTLMMVFDPLGLISFFMVYLKILLQKIWKTKTDWDEPIQNDHNLLWTKWTETLPRLDTIQIPRCIFPEEPINFQLHTFVDASDQAFSAVSYLVVKDKTEARCVLVCAKTKVAPLKILSIPRLELLAAVMGTRLSSWIFKVLKLKPSSQTFWSDSQNVLCWLRSESRKYRQFVAFRVAEILEFSKVEEWRWIPSQLNVADEATKWKKRPDVQSHSRWFQGPEFLLQDPKSWPTNEYSNLHEDQEEIGYTMRHTTPNNNILIPNFSRFTNYNRMVRCLAWALRWFYKYEGTIPNRIVRKPEKGKIKPYEYVRAEYHIFGYVQNQEFPEEVSALKSSPPKTINSASRLQLLSPFWTMLAFCDKEEELIEQSTFQRIPRTP